MPTLTAASLHIAMLLDTIREWSRVFYSIDLRIPSWIPGFVVNILNTQALTSVSLR